MSRLKEFARTMRNNPTDAEAALWRRIKGRQIEGVKFRRQQPIDAYIVDFVSFERRLVIELDGGQHAEAADRDRDRDRELSENGFHVLRFWDNEVLRDMQSVLEVIRREVLRERAPSPQPPPVEGGGR